MKTQKKFRLMSIVIMILGMVHVLAFPFIIVIARPLAFKEKLAFTFMYIMTGLATGFSGWLQYTVLKNFPVNFTELKIIKGTVVFITLLGFGAVVTMWDNPFAYISLLIALYEIYLLIKINK